MIMNAESEIFMNKTSFTCSNTFMTKFQEQTFTKLIR